MEYATREQAQQAVTQLSNQNLMGRLVYVREVCGRHHHCKVSHILTLIQDREAEPRFIGATGGGAAGGRGGFGGGMQGGFNQGFGGPPGGGAGGRQIYVANVRTELSSRKDMLC